MWNLVKHVKPLFVHCFPHVRVIEYLMIERGLNLHHQPGGEKNHLKKATKKSRHAICPYIDTTLQSQAYLCLPNFAEMLPGTGWVATGLCLGPRAPPPPQIFQACLEQATTIIIPITTSNICSRQVCTPSTVLPQIPMFTVYSIWFASMW